MAAEDVSASHGTEPTRTRAVKPVIKIKNYVRRHTSPVDLATLQGKGFKKVNLITLSKINRLIALAVESTFDKYSHCLGEVDKRRIEEEVQKELRRRIREQHPRTPDAPAEAAPLAASPRPDASRPAPGLSSPSPAGAGPVGSVAPPRLKIEPARMEPGRRASARHRGAAPAAAAAARDPERGADTDPFVDTESALRELIGRVLEEEYDRCCPPGEDIARDSRALDFKIALEEIVSSVLDARRLPEIVHQISNRRTDLLERRLEKLKRELLEMEVAMERLSAAKESSGLASIFREVRGLNQLDSGYEKKKGLLQSIFESNLKLQSRSTRRPATVDPSRIEAASRARHGC